MTLFLSGSTGTLGKELKKVFTNCSSPTHTELDITDRRAVDEFINKENIQEIIHTAALTSIRKCEVEKKLAWKVNVEGTRNLVESLRNREPSGLFIFISTACVFDGKTGMYTEISIPNPVNFYSLTKLIGESIVQTLPNHIIVRTNFVGKKKWPYEKAFTDRYGTYLFADDVAFGIKEIYDSSERGIIHLTGDKVLSMFDVANITTPTIEPMTINEYSGPHLTINMTLDSLRWKKYKISKFELVTN